MSVFSLILGIIIAIFLLGVLIFVHELGHLLMAKLGKIAVEEFSIGMGKEIWGFDMGGTRYRIGRLPFGGFCRMRGEENEDRKDGGEKIEKDPNAMYNRPAWARFITIIGGAGFNYLFAVLIMILLFMFGFNEEVVTPLIHVEETNASGVFTPAYLAGLRDGDLILEINGESVTEFADILEPVAFGSGEELSILYLRKGSTNFTTVIPVMDEEEGMGTVGIDYLYTSTIGGTAEGSAAELAGLEAGDKIIAINGNEVTYFNDIPAIVNPIPGQDVTLKIERSDEDGNTENFSQVLTVGTNENGLGILGVYQGEVNSEMVHRQAGFFRSFGVGFVEANALLGKTVKGLGTLFSGKVNVQKNVSGPIRIVQIMARVAMYTNFSALLQFMALISVALGFFNLLPIPGLDGASALVALFEMITTIRPPEKFIIALETVGMVFIIGLSILVFSNDLFNIFAGWFGK